MRHQNKYLEKLEPDDELPKEFKLSRSRIMYIEDKSEGLVAVLLQLGTISMPFLAIR